jgi:dephospho-CoA kinase
MFVLGLTGSIGMGKTTTAAMFRAEGIRVHDSDATVHELYRGAAAPAVEAAFPGVARDGVIDRSALGARVFDDPAALQRLEAIVHPLVAAAREKFLAEAAKAGARRVVLDVPLLFEIGADRSVDAVVLVSAPESVQKARAASRPGMTPLRLEAILAKQMPDAEKRARAHFIIDTGSGFEAARRQVRGVLRALAGAADKRKGRTEH